MPIPLVALIFSNLMPFSGGIHDLYDVHAETHFLRRFAGSWTQNIIVFQPGRTHGSCKDFSFQIHLRALSARPKSMDEKIPKIPAEVDGFRCARQRGPLPTVDIDKQQIVVEQRFSSIMRCTFSQEEAEPILTYKMVTLAYQTYEWFNDEVLGDTLRHGFDKSILQNHGMKFAECGPLKPIVSWLVILQQIVVEWAGEWKRTMRAIDAALKVEVRRDSFALRFLSNLITLLASRYPRREGSARPNVRQHFQTFQDLFCRPAALAYIIRMDPPQLRRL